MNESLKNTLAQVQRSLEKKASQGLPVSVDPDVADAMGAFSEKALDMDAAIQSVVDEEAKGKTG